MRDQRNLEAEIIYLLKALLYEDAVGLNLEIEEASRQARIDYASERLRLLYVGITRARRELMITWNTGRKGTCVSATPLLILTDYLEVNAYAPPN